MDRGALGLRGSRWSTTRAGRELLLGRTWIPDGIQVQWTPLHGLIIRCCDAVWLGHGLSVYIVLKIPNDQVANSLTLSAYERFNDVIDELNEGLRGGEIGTVCAVRVAYDAPVPTKLGSARGCYLNAHLRLEFCRNRNGWRDIGCADHELCWSAVAHHAGLRFTNIGLATLIA